MPPSLFRTFAALLFSSTFLLSPSPATLVWHSAMDGNANATTGSNGAPNGSPSAATDRFGNANSAVEFNGSNQYYDIGSYGNMTAGTMSIWAKTDSNSGERGMFCAGASGGGSSQYFSVMNQSGGQVRVDLDDGAARRDAQGGSMVVGQWMHIATTWSGSGTMRLYVDGIQVNTQGGLPSSVTMTSNGLIGTERTNSRYWDGTLDDAGIWDEELSHRKVAAIYGLGKIQGLSANHSTVDSIVNLTTLGQMVTAGATTWEYVSGLGGGTGTTGGSIAGEDAFIVLDGASGRGVQIASAPATPPTVVNSAATNIEPTSATLGGNVTDNGGSDPTVVLYYGDNDAGTSAGSWDSSVNFGIQGGSFSAGVSGLSTSTTYFFRCFASNSGGSDWADTTSSFTTGAPPNPPMVVNNGATNVSFEEADINSTVTSTGGEAPNVTFYFGDNDGGTNPGSWDGFVDLGAQSGGFSNSLFFLTNGTTHFYRAFAQNSGGSAWAPSSATFTTLAFSPPALTNTPASNVTGTAALVGGEITSTGGNAPSVTIYYGDNDGGTNTGSWDSSVALGSQSATFSTTLSSLSPLTTYYFRSLAQNSAGGTWASPTETFTTLEVSELVINEFMAANDGGLTNNPNSWYPIANQIPGATEDWIEILNTGAGTLDLAGWHLTDDPGDLSKWTFPPSTNLNSGAFLIVYASNANAPDANGNLHTNFKLSKGGEYLALVRPALTVASEFGPGGSDYPSQDDDVSYGLHPSTSDSVYFASPTPGSANDASGLARVGDTKFTPDRGYYQTAINVTITSDTPGATIYYTTDGTPPVDTNGNPTAGASTYTTPIALTQTTAVRAAAVKNGFAPTNIDAHTYLLLDIDNANADGTDSAGLNTPFLQQTQPGGWGNLSSGDFNMDTRVTKGTAAATGHPTSTAQTMLLGMRDIPTISIAMDRDDFTGGNGIYSNSTSRGFAWERACSAEFIPATGDTRSDWQENCGLRVQGGASRNPGSSPKHSLSFRFRADYGTGKLRQPLFPGSAVEEFNVIALRAGYNNSWIHSNSSQRTRGSMIRDQWMRQSMIDMGNPEGGEGFHVHLFINGLYWGVHNLCERGDAAHYAAHNGGDENLIDARNGSQFTDGNSTAWNQIDEVVSGGDWSKIQGVIDIETYIDYQIINRYGGNADLKSNGNWRAAGGGPFPGGSPEQMAAWQLYSWDGERTLESQTSGSNPLDPISANSPINVRSTLEAHAEYRIRFADRLQKHFFNSGALTPAATKARWMKYANDLDRAIIAESARWGDHRGTLYTRDNQWLTEQNRLCNSYFPVRTNNVLNGYGSLFPNTDAPVFRVNTTAQHGGEIPSGGTLTLTAPSGTIYYTTDGSDPRLEGGGINPSATSISSGSTVTLSSSGLVRTRALNGGDWSAMDQATFYIEPLASPGNLAVSEIHYNPYRATPIEKAAGAALTIPREFADPDVFEFLEIRNISASAVNLDGVSFSQGIAFTFGNIALPVGGHAVIARDSEAFAIRYPSATVAGSYIGSLDNAGEQLAYNSAAGAVMQDFTYDNGGQWPGRPDGNGSSLEVIDIAGDYNSPDNWRPSCEFNGSPGAAGVGTDGRVVINEVLSHTDLPQTDSIELLNTTGSSINIGGWILSDNNAFYPSFSLPAGSIGAGSYLTFDESDFNSTPTSPIIAYVGTVAAAPTRVASTAHGLATGDTVTIEGYAGVSAYNGTWEVTVISANSFTIDTPFLDNHATRGTWGRGRPFALSASKGEDLWLLETDVSGQPLKFVDHIDFAAAFNGESLGRWPNGAGAETLVSMTANTPAGANSGPQVGPVIISEVMYFPEVPTEDGFEFVELCNTGNVTENLANWRLRGGADYDFSAVHSIPPGESLVVVAFDPNTEITAASTFRSTYGIDSSIPLVGPFLDGPLGNITGTVRLQRPDSPPLEDPGFYPQVTEDAVTYQDSSPWPPGAAGNGSSLDRNGIDLFGNFATSWSAQPATPGGKRTDYTTWRTVFFGAGIPVGSGETDDFEGDGLPNIVEFALGLNPLIDDSHLAPNVVIEGANATVTYDKNLLLSGLTYRVEYSTNLLTWTTASEISVSSINYKETRKASVPMGSNPRLFVRLTVEG